ncbi:MAG: ABC transporter ATP-binding protein [Chloroflexi bacterium]|nr:ABC transporter ATP-binding protein [Chloroflexota bacterium]
MNNTPTSLRLDKVVKKFPSRDGSGEFTAVEQVSLEINKGEFVTLLGPSGCGKTTTLRLVAGFESPTSGKIYLNGKDITSQPPNKRDMAMVFQSYALFPHMTVFDNVAYGLQIKRLSKADIQTKVRSTLDLMGLGALAHRRPNQLSGGQQQRVALARALVMEPSILLFDEPLSNLDAKLRVQMRSEIHQLQRRLNITSVYVTHDQDEAMALSDRIVVMNAGRIEQMGQPEEIYRYPTTRFVADFIGRANFFESSVDGIENGCALVQMFGKTLRIPLHQTTFRAGEKVTAMMRPEAVKLAADPTLKQVKIEQVMYLGSEVEYTIAFDGQVWAVSDSDPRAGRAFAEGDMAGVTVIDDAVHLLKTES